MRLLRNRAVKGALVLLGAIVLVSLGVSVHTQREHARARAELQAPWEAGKYEEWVSTYARQLKQGRATTDPFRDVLVRVARGGQSSEAGLQRHALIVAGHLALGTWPEDDWVNYALLLLELDRSYEQDMCAMTALRQGLRAIHATRKQQSPLASVAERYTYSAARRVVALHSQYQLWKVTPSPASFPDCRVWDFSPSPTYGYPRVERVGSNEISNTFSDVEKALGKETADLSECRRLLAEVDEAHKRIEAPGRELLRQLLGR